MHVACPLCHTATDLDHQAAGTLVRCRGCGKSFVGPQELAVIGQPHKLTSFSVVGLLLLHYVTVGLFSVVHLNLMHDRLPRVRRSDPSGLVAVGLCFVPVINLVWFFFTLRRLCVRINEQRRLRGMPETAPQTMAITVSALLLCGFVATILPITGWVLLGVTSGILIPVFIAVLQASVNELVQHRGQPAPDLHQDEKESVGAQVGPPAMSGVRLHRFGSETRSQKGRGAPGTECGEDQADPDEEAHDGHDEGDQHGLSEAPD